MTEDKCPHQNDPKTCSKCWLTALAVSSKLTGHDMFSAHLLSTYGNVMWDEFMEDMRHKDDE